MLAKHEELQQGDIPVIIGDYIIIKLISTSTTHCMNTDSWTWFYAWSQSFTLHMNANAKGAMFHPTRTARYMYISLLGYVAINSWRQYQPQISVVWPILRSQVILYGWKWIIGGDADQLNFASYSPLLLPSLSLPFPSLPILNCFYTESNKRWMW